jgi:hypothetical protein
MDGIVLALFLVAAFVGGFASGLAGFAMGFRLKVIIYGCKPPLVRHMRTGNFPIRLGGPSRRGRATAAGIQAIHNRLNLSYR